MVKRTVAARYLPLPIGVVKIVVVFVIGEDLRSEGIHPGFDSFVCHCCLVLAISSQPQPSADRSYTMAALPVGAGYFERSFPLSDVFEYKGSAFFKHFQILIRDEKTISSSIS